MDAKRRRQFTDANRDAWDEVAPIHERHNQERLKEQFSEAGYNDLDQHCVKRLTELEVQGKQVAQLCCNNGSDLLSVKNMGAGACVGFDASDKFVEQARELAQVSGHADVEFIATDLYDIPPEFNHRFDIVMTTIGVLGWMPDLQGFFNVVARLVRPSGHVFMEEMHPVLMMYEEGEGSSPSYLAYSYFQSRPWEETSGLDYYGKRRYQSKVHYSFQHTLSEMFMAAIRSGLALKHFVELPYDISSFCSDLENAVALPPLGMTLVWQKTAVA